ncbi:MAG: hypothetical protein DRQ43_11460, partial [Gammaproteobacteria bacterium]
QGLFIARKMENLFWNVIKQLEKNKLMKIDNIGIIPKRWQTSDKQIKGVQLAFQFEHIVRQIKTLYLGAVKRLEKKIL